MRRATTMRRALTALGLFAASVIATGCAGTTDDQATTETLQPPVTDKQPEFFGVGGTAEKIAYVIDRSGSMTDTFPAVKAELRRSIRMLRPNQRFYTVFYSSGPAVELPARKMVPATEANKLNAYEFIDAIVPVGQTHPEEALRMAFAAKPTIVYLMTDGEFNRTVVALIDKLNADRKVTVNTICVVYNSGEQVLREIARKNGGQYVHVAQKDLTTQP